MYASPSTVAVPLDPRPDGGSQGYDFVGWSLCLTAQGCADCERGTVLQLLANSKLVAVCQLQHCKLTLVPYLEARSGQLRLMGFLIADDLGT